MWLSGISDHGASKLPGLPVEQHCKVIMNAHCQCLVGCWSFTYLQHLRSYQDSEHSWWLYSAAILGNQAAGTMTWYPTQSHYPDTELTSVTSTILLIPGARLGRHKDKLYESFVWLNRESNSWSLARDARALPIRPPRPMSSVGAHCLVESVAYQVDTYFYLSWRSTVIG